MLVNNKRKQILTGLVVSLILLWVVGTLGHYESLMQETFTNIYAVVPLVGGVLGLGVARQWGGFNSYLGKALSFLSIGLLLTVLGQLVNSYYVLIAKVDELPYPSFAEIGFFGAVLAYIAGAFYLSKTIRLVPTLKEMSIAKKSLILLIPFLMIVVTLLVYLYYYDSSSATNFQIILDFAYPIGQSIFAAIALAVLFRSKDLYGGKMQLAVILLLISFILQYIADTNFVYLNLAGLWVNGGYGDLLYLLAYSATALGIQSFSIPTTTYQKRPEEQ